MGIFFNESDEPRLGCVVPLVVGAFFVVVFSFVGLTSMRKTPRDHIGISYGGGPIEGAHFQRIVEPGSGLFFNGLRDQLYLYPVTQRNYIISHNPSEGDVKAKDSITAPSKDRVNVEYETAVYFKLNTDKLRKFHEQIGLKFHAWEEEGWDQMLRQSFRQQIEVSLQRESRSYALADIFANRDTLAEIQNGIAQDLKGNVARILGDDYFCGPTYEPGGTCTDFRFAIKRVHLPGSVLEAYAANRTSEINVLTKQNEIKQRQAEAKAIEALNAALERAGDSYVLLKAIESGKVEFWVIPDGQGLTVQRSRGE